MRRLLASVAVLAFGLLAVPSAALALDAPIATGPAATNLAPVITWTDVAGATVYHVLRDDAACANPQPIGADVAPAVQTFTDNTPNPPAEGSYCYVVQADDGTTVADSAPVPVTYDTTSPVIAPVTSGGTGCTAFTVSATAADNLLPVTMSTDVFPNPYVPGTVLTPVGLEFALGSVTFTAVDAAGNSASATLTGQVLDATRPPTPVLELATDPVAQKVTLSWASVTSDGAPVIGYHVQTKGPTGGDVPVGAGVSALVISGLQVDATYEYSLFATDACGDSLPSIRLVRLNDTTPPSKPLAASPTFIASSRAVTLSWVPSADNVQVDHYQILRNGVPLGVTDTASFTDPSPGQHASLTYVVRAVDTNGNQTDSDPVTITTPDWTPPTAPIPTVTALGRTVTLTWKPAVDNVGVVGYDVFRDGRLLASMTGAQRTAKDFDVPLGRHTWIVRARDDAGNATDSAPQTLLVRKLRASATVVAVKMAGAARGHAARYNVAGSARLLIDVRVIGTLAKAKLRFWVQSGTGRITIWRGTPGSSSPRERLHSGLSRHGFVTIPLGQSLHAGRTRLVLIAGGHVVIVASGKHKPSLRAG